MVMDKPANRVAYSAVLCCTGIIALLGVVVVTALVMEIQDFKESFIQESAEFKELADGAWFDVITEVSSGRFKRQDYSNAGYAAKMPQGAQGGGYGNNQTPGGAGVGVAGDGAPVTPDGGSGADDHVSAECPRGPPGPAGHPGPAGPDGMDGVPGNAGTPGSELHYPPKDENKGECVKCPAGPPGPKGPAGPVGKIGYQGLPGMDGRPGANGKPGHMGPVGDQGLTGQPGMAGHPGYKGQGGYRFVGAKPGPPGAPGMMGGPGKPGIPGPNGQPGKTGAMGEAGLGGMDGSPGYNGRDGMDGRPGTPGMDAEYCPCPKRNEEADPNSTGEYSPVNRNSNAYRFLI